MPYPMHVAIIDDHPAILSGVEGGLRHSFPHAEPASLRTVAQALDAGHDFAAVLLDIQLDDGTDPAQNTARLVARGWPVLLYTQETRRSVVASCLKAGALGIVGKKDTLDDLLAALACVLDGEPYLSPEWAAILDEDAAWRIPNLTDREQEAVRLYALGLPLKSVGRRMNVSPDTAREYLLRARRKYGEVGRPADTRTDLYIRAVEDGRLPSPTPF